MTYIHADLTNTDSIKSAFDTIAGFGPVTGLVNNAGFAISHSIAETGTEDFEKLVPLNLVAPAMCTRLAAPLMQDAGWGRIVNISSRAALGKELRTAYAATKGGLNSMTRVWALELAAAGITVNSVGPGPIDTELFQKVNPAGSPRTLSIIDSIPVKRLGTADDIANVVMFFLGQDSGFVTGQTIYACGGLTIGTSVI